MHRKEFEIKKDLNRTFPNDAYFKPGAAGYKALGNILFAITRYDP